MTAPASALDSLRLSLASDPGFLVVVVAAVRPAEEVEAVEVVLVLALCSAAAAAAAAGGCLAGGGGALMLRDIRGGGVLDWLAREEVVTPWAPC